MVTGKPIVESDQTKGVRGMGNVRSAPSLERTVPDLGGQGTTLSGEEGLLDALAHVSADAIFIVNRAGNIVFANTEAGHLLDLATPGDLPGQNIADLIISEQGLSFLRDYDGDRGDRTCFLEDYEIRTVKGQPKRIQGRIAKARYKGNPVLVLSAHDVSEGKRAKNELLESEKRFGELADLLPQSVFETDENGHLTFVNKYAFAQWGYTNDDLKSEKPNILQMVAPEDRGRVLEQMENVAKGSQVQGEMYSALRKDGTRFPILVYVDPVMKDGGFVGLRGIAIDISMQKHAEEALRESQETERALLNATNDIAFLIDREGKFLVLNERTAGYVGRPVEELLGKSAYDRIASCLAEPKRPYVEEVFRSGKPIRFVDSSNGVAFDNSIFPILDGDGNVVRLAVYARDITESKKAEEALRESEERFRILTEESPVGVYVVQDGVFQYVNPAFAAIHGMHVDEMTYRFGPLDFIVSDDRDRAAELLGQSEDKKYRGTGHTYRMVRKDGSDRTVEIHGSWIMYNGRQAVLGTLLDITDRKQAEERLTHYAEMLQLVLTASASFISLSPDQIDRGINDVLKVLGEFANVDRSYLFQVKDDGQVMNVTHEWCDGELPAHMEEFKRIEAAEMPWFFERIKQLDIIRMRGVDEFPAETRTEREMRKLEGVKSFIAVPISYSGALIGYIGLDSARENINWPEDTVSLLKVVGEIFANVLAHRRSEEVLRTQAQIIDQIHDAVITTDLEGYVTSWNNGAERLFAYEHDEVLHRHISFLYTKGTDGPFQAGLVEELAEKGSKDREVKAVTKAGNQIYAHLLLSILRGEKGEPKGIIGYHVDITRSKNLEEQLKHAQKLEAIGQLAGGVAHDFNNILSVIIGSVSLMRRKLDEDSPLVNYTNQIALAGERAANLTKSLLAFSRKQIMNPKPVELNDMVNNEKKLLSRLINEDIELRTECKKMELPIFADGAQMEQILMNLVTNARDAMPSGGVITIKTGTFQMDAEFVRSHGFGKPGEYCVLSVADTGSGMDETTKSRIFDPFFTTKEVGKGTGLGLSIIYGIVKQHNGFITVDSEAGLGSVFNVYLPILKKAVKEEPQEITPVPAGGTETVLIAEDELSVRTLMKDVLENYGYTVLEAENGDEALKLFKERYRDIRLLILDVVMPKKGGMAIYNEVRKIKPDVKTLFMSGYSLDIIREKGVFETGAYYIPKPVMPDKLLIKVQEILARRS
jgi:PAS domain S-box-containing protein